MTTPIRINDFVVKFANVNGSGSASANGLFAKAILRMGVPVAARNIFPSNIQGLPTWFEVRVVEDGWRGRRGGVDLMVAMNPQTWDKDLAEIDAGGWVFYDSTKPMPPSKFREDVITVGIPLTAICNAEYTDARQRQLFKNIIYLGALSALLDIDADVVEKLFGEQYKGKEALLESNRKAFRMGREHALKSFECPLPIRVRKSDRVGERIFIDGNSAAALGSVYGGATVAAWYPITPSSSLAEAFTSYCRKFRTDPVTGKKRYAILQAEDELSSIGMVIGAAWNGARAFTTTSGPGVSLMQEFLGLAYFAEIPVVLFDVQRGSPSTGMPTRTQQADLFSCAYASHGDTKHVMLLPEDPREAFDFAASAFDLADRLQTPIFVMLDLDIGMQDWLCEPFAWDDNRRMDRGKVMSAADLDSGRDFGRYLDVDGDGIPFRTYPGTHPTKGSYFTRGTTKDRYARYTEEGVAYVDNMQRLQRKFETAKSLVPAPSRAEGVQADAHRHPLVRLHRCRDGRVARCPRARRHPPRPHARARVPVRGERARIHRHARPGVRRRAESRCADEGAAGERVRHRSGAAHLRAALRRHADHRPLHHPRDRREGASLQRNAAAQVGCRLTPTPRGAHVPPLQFADALIPDL